MQEYNRNSEEHERVNKINNESEDDATQKDSIHYPLNQSESSFLKKTRARSSKYYFSEYY
jgi:hypothetical protein